MRKVARIALPVSFLFLLFGASRLYADSVTITSGFFDAKSPLGASSSSVLTLTGTGGFTMNAFPDLSIGSLEPLNCRMIHCAPGTTISLAGAWLGHDLLGATVTYQGVTYTHVGDIASDSSSRVAFAGTAIAPLFTGETTAIVQAPFTFTGEFRPGVEGIDNATLSGQGIATLFLNLDTSFGDLGLSWAPTEVRYDFSPVPEPSSLLLFGSGLLGAAGYARLRVSSRRRRG